MFLITGAPRSATMYTATLLKRLGHNVQHQQAAGIGCVSWYHALQVEVEQFEPILHQVRHPLGVIGSMTTISARSWGMLEKITGECPYPGPVYRAAWTWLAWTRHCDEIASWRYCVEDLPEVYPDLFERLGLPVPGELPRLPLLMHTRPHARVTWETLNDVDFTLCADVLDRAREYGYE